MEMLLEAVRAYTPINEEEGAHFHAFFSRKTYKKNAVLLKEGEVAHELFFIVKGTLRQYFINEKGAERTCNFAFEQEFVTDLESFSKQTKSATHITALEPTECLVITCKDVVACMANSTAASAFFNRLVELVALQNVGRIKSLLSQSPEQQFEELIQAKPQSLQRVPQRYIAQYLGIAPESLSRIRKRMLYPAKS